MSKTTKTAKSIGKILIVEDNELNLKLFRDLLKSYGYMVLDTKDGSEAISLVKEHLPNLIIMDIQLRGLSGFDIIQQIKADKDIQHIPIVAVTAFAMKDDKDRILASGCEAYVPKPISIVPFLEVIRKHIKLEV